MKVTQNIFLEFHGGSNPNEITIIPVEVQFNFWGVIRKGIGSKNGHSQEFASKWEYPFLIEMKPC